MAYAINIPIFMFFMFSKWDEKLFSVWYQFITNKTIRPDGVMNTNFETKLFEETT